MTTPNKSDGAGWWDPDADEPALTRRKAAFAQSLDDWDGPLGTSACLRHPLRSASGGAHVTGLWDLMAGDGVSAIGSIECVMSQHQDGCVIHYRDITVASDARGANVARSLWTHQAMVYRDLGAIAVRGRADKAGSYLWATCGFEIADGIEPLTRCASQEVLREMLDEPLPASLVKEWPDRKEAAAMIAAVEESPAARSAVATPSELAVFGRDLAAGTGRSRIGKEVLLRTAWDAVFRL